MKKMLALLLAAVMVLSMAACAARLTRPLPQKIPRRPKPLKPLKPTKPPRLPQRKRPLPSPKI